MTQLVAPEVQAVQAVQAVALVEAAAAKVAPRMEMTLSSVVPKM